MAMETSAVLRFRALGFRVWGLGFMVSGLGIVVLGRGVYGFRVEFELGSLGLRIPAGVPLSGLPNHHSLHTLRP